MELGRVLCVDPGLGGTGLAFWSSLSGSTRASLEPLATQVLKGPASGKYTWVYRAKEISFDFRISLIALKPQKVVFEVPGLWAGSAKSMASATRGDLFKEAMLVGMLMHAALELEGCDIYTVTPLEWKGQLSKQAVDNRIVRALGRRRTFPNHVSDAVGMGLAAVQKL